MGYTAVSSNGSAADLCQLILRDNPQGKLLHIRGEVSHGNVMQVLVHGGLECHEVVVYTKQPRCPDVSVRNMISSLQYFILPIFSTETVSIIASWGINLNAAHVVAISELVASEAESVIDAVEVTSADELVEDVASDLDGAAQDPVEEAPTADNVDSVVDDRIEVVDDLTVEPSDAIPVSPADPQTGTGFLPLLLGGVVAGAIGYGIATYYPLNRASDDLAVKISAQAEQIAALQEQLANSATVDLTPMEVQLQTLADEVSAQTSALSTNIETGLAALDERLLEVEKRPGADGTLSDSALAAYQRELEDLRADLDAQQANVMSAAAQAEADLAAARAEAEILEQQAVAAAEAAASRAALNPDFPANARAALATARAEGVSGESGGLGGFLRNQFDVRSTSPQEGDNPDAVLSRAEAACKRRPRS
ncbi:hypothetical protein GQR58_002206 [Nymphon striatum]|nr:hypothetical protein GQR58_002206 [Nymphon striatum]